MEAPVVGRVPIGIDPVFFSSSQLFCQFFFQTYAYIFHFHFLLCPLLFIFRKSKSHSRYTFGACCSSLFVSLFLVGCANQNDFVSAQENKNTNKRPLFFSCLILDKDFVAMPVVPLFSNYPPSIKVAWCQPVSSEGPPVSDFCRRDPVYTAPSRASMEYQKAVPVHNKPKMISSRTIRRTRRAIYMYTQHCYMPRYARMNIEAQRGHRVVVTGISWDVISSDFRIETVKREREGPYVWPAPAPLVFESYNLLQLGLIVACGGLGLQK